MDDSKIEEILAKYEELRTQRFIDLTSDFGFKRIFTIKEFMIDFLNVQEFWLVNLPKFRQMLPESCRTGFDCWLFIISNIKKMKEMPFLERKPIFRGVKSMTELAAMSKKDRSAYMLEYDAYRTDAATYDWDMRTSRAEGRAEGEKSKAIETASKMKQRGYPIDVISDITGLSPDEIEKI